MTLQANQHNSAHHALESGAFSPQGKVLLLRYTRLGRVPPGQYAAELMKERGLPVLCFEYGFAHEPDRHVLARIPRWREGCEWAERIPGKFRVAATFVNAFVKLLSTFRKEGRPALMIAHGLQEQALAFLLSRATGTPYAVHVHEVYEEAELTSLNRIFFRLESHALRHAEFLIFPEAARAKVYRERYQLTNPIYLAFNCPRKSLPRIPRDLRRALGLEKESHLVGYMGGIGDVNGFKELIGALPRLPSVHLLISGWGDEDYLRQSMALARELGVRDRVHYLGEIEDKWSLLPSLDLAYCVYRPQNLRTKFQATASNKLTEAMSVGVPVITSSNTDFRAVVESLQLGICLPEISSEAIANSLLPVLANPSHLKRLGQNGRRAHEELFNYEEQFQKLIPRIGKYLT